MRLDADLLMRFWFEFDRSTPEASNLLAGRGALLGCGVTEYSYDDAIYLLRTRLFWPDPLPPISRVIENVNIATLDRGHVLPNMGLHVLRGVWFPALEDWRWKRGDFP